MRAAAGDVATADLAADLAAGREAIAALAELLDAAARRLDESDPATAQALRLELWIVQECLPAALSGPR